MRLHVQREPSRNGRTFGSLYIDGVWFCWTLEDEVREPESGFLSTFQGAKSDWVRTWKVQGQTAIPYGIYPVKLTLSNRFKVVLPELLHVPGFLGIRIHAGNTEHDTEGCILVGTTRTETDIRLSMVAKKALMGRLTGQKNISLTVLPPLV